MPEEPQLRQVAEQLEKADWWAWLIDDKYRLVWGTSACFQALRVESPEEVGCGKHVLEAFMNEAWTDIMTPDSQLEVFRELLPMIMHDPEWDAELSPEGKERFGPFIESLEPAFQPPVYTTQFGFINEIDIVTTMKMVLIRLHDLDGKFIGAIGLDLPGLRPDVVEMLLRGNPEAFERMMRLAEPGRHAAAILFADLQDSGALSRRLSSATYFSLIQGVTSAIDTIVVEACGVIGEHAGDGITAFFLAEECGSSSRAARHAIDAAREIGIATRTIAKRIAEDTNAFDPEDVVVNVGVHYGGTLYMGQLVTGGRLEITALGDEVNECARIKECARDGRALASKALMEHLDPSDEHVLGIDLDALTYSPISTLPDATEKAKRDAGGIPVTVL